MLELLLGGVLLALPLAMWSFALLQQRIFCRYDVSRDYHYDLSDLPSETRELDARGELPVQAAGTLLLRVRLRRRLSGWWRSPSVHVQCGERQMAFCFELGAAGARYLDVSPLLAGAAEPTSLRLSPLRCALLREVDIHAIPARLPETGHVLVVSPHPDDAEIAAFGLYSALRERSSVVTLTAGDSGDWSFRALHSDAEQNYRAKGEVRVIDSISVPMLAGIPPERALNLGYFTGRLQQMREQPQNSFGALYSSMQDIRPFRQLNLGALPANDGQCSWANLLQDLQQLLGQLRPSLILIPHPLLDAHVDHKLTAAAVSDALGSYAGRDEVSIALYINHPEGCRQFPFGAREAGNGLPPYHGGRRVGWPQSQCLDETTQQHKLLALEAMHDLRLLSLSSFMGRPWRECREVLRCCAVHALKNLGGRGPDFLRRAPRPSELFYCVDRLTLAAMVEEACGPGVRQAN